MLYSVSLWRLPASRVSLTIGKKAQLVCQSHCHFTDLLMSLSIGASGTIAESPRMKQVWWIFPYWPMHWLEDFSLAALVGGFKRGTDTVTVMEHHKNWVVMHQTPRFWSIWLFWPIWLLANLNHKSLTQPNRAQDYPGWDHKVYPSSVPRSRMKIHTER